MNRPNSPQNKPLHPAPKLGARPLVRPSINPQGQGMTTSAGLRPVMDRPVKRPAPEFTAQLRVALRSTLEDGVQALRLELSQAQIDKCIEFIAFLSEWNAVINLTAIREPGLMLSHHVLDALAVMPHLPAAMPKARAEAQRLTLLDVGSGGGVPAAIIAIVRPDIEVVAIDAVRKKTDFVQRAAQHLALPNLSAVHSRVEDHAKHYDIVISRAFASLADFAKWAGPRVGDQTRGARMLAMKGKVPTDEIAELHVSWRVAKIDALHVPGLDAERCLLQLERVATK